MRTLPPDDPTLGLFQVLREDGTAAPGHDPFLDSTKLLAIINDILDLTTIDAGGLELKLAPVSVREIAEAAELGVKERLAKSGITLDTQIAPELDMVVADRQRLTQVLFHLLSNAIGFSSERSVITLSCRIEDGMVAFAVQDSGVGISTESTDHLFKAFYTTKQNGLGMGLSICRSIIEAHGGRLSASDNAGPGATFCFALPSHHDSPPHDGAPRETAS